MILYCIARLQNKSRDRAVFVRIPFTGSNVPGLIYNKYSILRKCPGPCKMPQTSPVHLEEKIGNKFTDEDQFKRTDYEEIHQDMSGKHVK